MKYVLVTQPANQRIWKRIEAFYSVCYSDKNKMYYVSIDESITFTNLSNLIRKLSRMKNVVHVTESHKMNIDNITKKCTTL